MSYGSQPISQNENKSFFGFSTYAQKRNVGAVSAVAATALSGIAIAAGITTLILFTANPITLFAAPIVIVAGLGLLFAAIFLSGGAWKNHEQQALQKKEAEDQINSSPSKIYETDKEDVFMVLEDHDRTSRSERAFVSLHICSAQTAIFRDFRKARPIYDLISKNPDIFGTMPTFTTKLKPGANLSIEEGQMLSSFLSDAQKRIQNSAKMTDSFLKLAKKSKLFYHT